MTRSLSACEVCAAYAARRAAVLDPHLRLRAAIRGVDLTVVTREYMFRVHRRHLAGLSLSTRTFTPVEKLPGGGERIRVQRVCNGCYESVGDANATELDHAVAGLQLPDVRLECGCFGRDGAAA